MDPPLNPYKGYGKINGHLELEDQTHRHKPPRKSLLLTVSAVLCLTLTLAFMLAALLHHSTTESSSLDSSIELVCNVTRYPDSCFSSISSLNAEPGSADPEAIFKLSLRVSVDALSGLSSLLKSGAKSEPALGDCQNLFEDALGRLNESVAAMREVALTERKISDVQTWISAAVTDQETCSDGLEEMGSSVGERVKIQMQRCKELTSNSLAIIAHINALSQKFHNPIP